MTRDEFGRRSQNFYRFQRRAIAVGASVIIATFLAWQPVLVFLFEKGSPEWDSAGQSFAGAHLVFSTVVVVVMAWFIGAAARRLGLTCPGCGVRLLGKREEGVLATGVCGKCGAAVVQEGTGVA